MATETQQVKQVVTTALERFGAEPDDITPDATFEALAIDSLDLAELSQIVEDEFGVRLTSADVAGVKTVGEAIDLIASRG